MGLKRKYCELCDEEYRGHHLSKYCSAECRRRVDQERKHALKRKTFNEQFLEEAKREYATHEDWFVETARSICIYCAEPANHEDHVLPKSVCPSEMRKQVPTVPSCGHCNNILGEFMHSAFDYRREHIATRLRAKGGQSYKAFMAGNRISQEDLDELGPNLRSYIERSQMDHRIRSARLTVLESGGAPAWTI